MITQTKPHNILGFILKFQFIFEKLQQLEEKIVVIGFIF